MFGGSCALTGGCLLALSLSVIFSSILNPSHTLVVVTGSSLTSTLGWTSL